MVRFGTFSGVVCGGLFEGACYHWNMTTVEILFRFNAPPNESGAMALAGVRDVYGIRRVSLDPAARTVRVEYDATRLNASSVTRLIRMTGLEIAEELPLIPPVAEPEAAPAV